MGKPAERGTLYLLRIDSESFGALYGTGAKFGESSHECAVHRSAATNVDSIRRVGQLPYVSADGLAGKLKQRCLHVCRCWAVSDKF